MKDARVLGVLAALLAGCIGINPDYDEESLEDSVSPADATGVATVDGEPNAESASSSRGESATGDDGVAESCTSLDLALCVGTDQTYCADLFEDDLNCGACFNACDALLSGSSCDDGVCRCPSGGGWRICGTKCAQTREDPTACGSACIDCTLLLGPMADCRNGECRPHDPNDDDDDDDD